MCIIWLPFVALFVVELCDLDTNGVGSTITGDVYIIELSNKFGGPLGIKYYDTWSTASQQRKLLPNNGSWCVVINGWYFAYRDDWSFQPAGTIIIKQFRKIIPSEIDLFNDPNITTIIRYNGATSFILDHKSKPISSWSYNYNFYAWPIIIKDGILFSWDIAQSTHGAWSYYRTFIARRQWWRAYVWVTTKPMTLYTLWTRLQSILPDIDFVVNLDGWPSTSISSAEYSFNENQKLPRFFYTCK
jgi:exopolysaccharide biosynthesis protein